MAKNGNSKQVGDIKVRDGENVFELIPFGQKEPIQLTLRLVRDYIAVPTKSGKKPELADCMHFIMMCKARGLNPWEGDCFMIGYDHKTGPKAGQAEFSLITAHQAFLKRAELHPDYDGMESGVIVQDETGAIIELPGDLVPPDYVLIGGWAKVHSKNKNIPIYRRLDVSKYRPTYYNKFWDEKDGNPAGMIVKCAEADALRSSYPTKLGGLYLREEMARIEEGMPTQVAPPLPEGQIPVETEIDESKTKTETLADKLKGGEESQEDITKVVEEIEGQEKPPAKPKAKKKTEKPAIDPTWEKVLMMSNGDEEIAGKKLQAFLVTAGRDPEGKMNWDALSVPDKNCVRPHIEEAFKKQSEPQMSLDE